MAYFHHLKQFFILFFLVIFSTRLSAQEAPYTFSFAPDLWYNDVDGIRIGLRTLGEVEGTFKDGPHRLDAGLWVSTWMPDLPVSYYFSFTEPIQSISSYSNEGSIQLISSIREGYSAHRIQFNKRFQVGFEEYNYSELEIYFSQEKLIDDEYRQYTAQWQREWKSLLGTYYRISKDFEVGRFFALLNVEQNINSKSKYFTLGSVEAQQKISIYKAFNLRIRAFFGYGSNDIAPEYGFLSSMESSNYWVNRGIPRSKGTLPEPWFAKGVFQIGGGANLRGYLKRDITELNAGGNPSYQSIAAINTEFEFPNFINSKIKDISIVGDLVEFRSYLFVDVGLPVQQGDEGSTVIFSQIETTFADAGTGFQLSVNIPDYLGKDRGIFVRYDIPFWLSDPWDNESNFAFRQLIGIGAIISF